MSLTILFMWKRIGVDSFIQLWDISMKNYVTKRDTHRNAAQILIRFRNYFWNNFFVTTSTYSQNKKVSQNETSLKVFKLSFNRAWHRRAPACWLRTASSYINICYLEKKQTNYMIKIRGDNLSYSMTSHVRAFRIFMIIIRGHSVIVSAQSD